MTRTCTAMRSSLRWGHMEDCSEVVISRQARRSSGFSISFPSKLIHVLILRLLHCQELRALVSLENPEILTTSHTQAWNEVRSPHGSSPSWGMPSTFRLNKCNPNLLFPKPPIGSVCYFLSPWSQGRGKVEGPRTLPIRYVLWLLASFCAGDWIPIGKRACYASYDWLLRFNPSSNASSCCR